MSKSPKTELEALIKSLLKQCLPELSDSVQVEVALDGEEPTNPDLEALATLDFEFTGKLKIK